MSATGTPRPTFGIEELTEVVRDVLGDSSVELRPEADASSVPGWDSLQHTLIMLEISDRIGVELDAMETASMANFGELLELIAATSGRSC